ncbi:MAG: hypothetical protein NUW22_11510, partial [Acidobacteria bacterium]|nr:hypothetical protein [Acidobacteriota bacterium]
MTGTYVQATLPDGARWQPEQPTDPDCRAVLFRLRLAAPLAVERRVLAADTGLSDRTVREAIERLVTEYLWP